MLNISESVSYQMGSNATNTAPTYIRIPNFMVVQDRPIDVPGFLIKEESNDGQDEITIDELHDSE